MNLKWQVRKRKPWETDAGNRPWEARTPWMIGTVFFFRAWEEAYRFACKHGHWHPSMGGITPYSAYQNRWF